MNKIFLDTNIVMDWLLKREPFFKSAQAVLRKVERKEIKALVSPMSFITIEYILRKRIGKEKAKRALAAIRTICVVCNCGKKEIDLALISSFKDFEDGVQYFIALNNGADIIITRNKKDFKIYQIL